MTRYDQTAEPVERNMPRAPAPGLLHQPIPRAVWLPLAIIGTIAALLLALNAGVLHIYQKHFTEKLPSVRMPWKSLSASMDETAVRGMFPGVNVRCMAQVTDMGDRVCYTSVERVDGYPALTVAFFFRKGRLNLATVHVPWWGHGRAADALVRDFGPHQRDWSGPMRLRRWDMQQGTLQMNESRSINPLSWSAIVWTAQGAK
jgi:hypothetical protein